MLASVPTHPFRYTARLPLPSARHAQIVAEAVSADPELRPELVRRTLHTDGCDLVLDLRATDARSLRTAVTSLYDFVRVSVTTLAAFPES